MANYVSAGCNSLVDILLEIPETDDFQVQQKQGLIQRIQEIAKGDTRAVKYVTSYQKKVLDGDHPDHLERDCIRWILKLILAKELDNKHPLNKQTQKKVQQFVLNKIINDSPKQESNASQKLVQDACQALTLIVSQTSAVTKEKKDDLTSAIKTIALQNADPKQAGEIEEKFMVTECLQGKGNATSLLIEKIISEIALDESLQLVLCKAVENVFKQNPFFPHIHIDEDKNCTDTCQFDLGRLLTSIVDRLLSHMFSKTELDTDHQEQAIKFFLEHFENALTLTVLDKTQGQKEEEEFSKVLAFLKQEGNPFATYLSHLREEEKNVFAKFLYFLKKSIHADSKTRSYEFNKETFQAVMGSVVTGGKGRNIPLDFRVNMKIQNGPISQLVDRYNSLESAKLESVAEEKELVAKEKELLAKEKESVAEEKESVAEEKELLAKEKELLAKEKELLAKEKELLAKKEELLERVEIPKITKAEEKELVAKEKELVAKEKELLAKEKELLAKEKKLVAEEKELLAKKEELVERVEIPKITKAAFIRCGKLLNDLLMAPEFELGKLIIDYIEESRKLLYDCSDSQIIQVFNKYKSEIN